MMWLLLFALTALVAVVPLWPAIQEWRRPSDAEPLHIDSEDALDPCFLAHDFSARLARANASGQERMGEHAIGRVGESGRWPLTAAEQQEAATARIWQCGGGAVLPPGIRFLAEVSAQGDLRSAEGGHYHALLTAGRLQLSRASTVARWAHGLEVDVGDGCQLRGRVSAERIITLRSDATFTLLHAPQIAFEAARLPAVLRLPVRWTGAAAPCAAPVRWDPVSRRGSSNEKIQVDGQIGWRGDLVSQQDIVLGAGCQAEGSLKARGEIRTGVACVVNGSIVAEGPIELGAQGWVAGSVVSETRVVLGAGCVVGAPGKPATVAAPRIDVGPGAVVHGTLWAGELGRCMGAAVGLTATSDAALVEPQRLAA